jgi:hypothetical protein
MYEVLKHDRSKFSPEQFEPYIELTEYYRRRRDGEDYDYPAGVRAIVDKAVTDHYCRENHHPEKFEGDLGKYSKLQAFETACDLQAMAQEFNEGTCRKYYEDVWKPRSAKYFYDDYNWECVKGWMNQAIECFEENEAAKLAESVNV